MRPNMLSLDMDFRVIPSAIPLHSPSPDRKTISVITPTISPNAIEIKKGSTPIKNARVQKQNYKGLHQLQTDFKYHSHSEAPYSALKQKDDMIKNLQNIIDMITDNSRYKKSDESQLKNQVKILTIQNQKLVNIIEKMSKNKNFDNHSKQNQQEQKINELLKKIKDNQGMYQQQTKQLKKFNKSMNIQLKNMQNEKKQLELENKKLLRILKQKNEGDKIISQKLKLSETSEHSIDQKMQTMTTNKSQEKLSLVKIRQQHSENLKILKEGLIKQIEETFDTMKIALDGINSKINGLAMRLESIQKLTWARIRRPHIERESIIISIREDEAHEGEDIDRSFKLQKKNNSQIYIEEGPSSSHERASRDEFARLQEIPSQKNLTAALQQELTAARAELSELRFKYEKLCLDTSSVGFSQKLRPNESMELEEEYIQEIDKKDKQISILYAQITQIEEQNIKNLQQKNLQIAEKDQQLTKLKQNFEDEKYSIKQETEQKVGLLVQNYEKQSQILRKQVSNLKKLLEADKKVGENIPNQIQQAQLLQLQDKNRELQEHLKSCQLEVQALEQKYEYEHKILTNALEQSERNAEKQRISKEDLEQQSLILISQVNQHKNYIESLRYELAGKNQQFENMKNLSSQSEESCRKQIENNRKLRELLIEREKQLTNIRKLVAEWSSSSLMPQLDQINDLIENTNEIQEQTSAPTWKQYGDLSSIQEQLQELRQQNNQLRQQLVITDQLKIQLESRVSELQNLYEITKAKLKEQQELYIKILEKLGEAEIKLAREITSREKSQQKLTTLKSNSKGIIIKVDEARKFESGRMAQISKILQGQDKKIE